MRTCRIPSPGSTPSTASSALGRSDNGRDSRGVIIDAMADMEVVLGDIVHERVDAIVTAANESLLGGGGVDWAVHQAAGPRLAEAGAAIAPCDPGDAKATPAFDLDPPVRYVIHTVGPIWDGGAYGEAATLASCYRRCLQVADDLAVTSIAFPAIATGVYGFPPEYAARNRGRHHSLDPHRSPTGPARGLRRTDTISAPHRPRLVAHLSFLFCRRPVRHEVACCEWSVEWRFGLTSKT
jgi:O-acetyl-ADP-ribose deacetylase